MNRSTLLTLITLCLFHQNLSADMKSANASLARGDFAAASAEFLRLANDGDAKAQAHLGYMYYVGEGVEQNYAEAVKWYRKAAVQGDKDAQYNLAVANAFGEGTSQDYKEAATWYRRAAEQGHPIAQYSLGISYSYGEGVKQDSAEAVKWFRQSADQGYARAQVQLAARYHTGDGVALDYGEAVTWYRKAADKGDAAAQYNLGSMYRSGKGVPQDYNQSIRWYRLAADQGYAAASNELSSLERAIAGAQRSRSSPNLQPAAKQQVAAAKTETTDREPLLTVEKSDLLTLDKEEESTEDLGLAETESMPDDVQDSYGETGADEKKPGRVSGFFRNLFKKKEQQPEAESLDAGAEQMAMQDTESLPEVVDDTQVMEDTPASSGSSQEMEPEQEVVAEEAAQKKPRFGFFKKLFGKKEAAEDAAVEDYSVSDMDADSSMETIPDDAVAYGTNDAVVGDTITDMSELDSRDSAIAMQESETDVMAEEAMDTAEAEQEPEKRGFFKRLFGKKKDDSEVMSDEPEPMPAETVAMVDDSAGSVPHMDEDLAIEPGADEQAAMDALEVEEKPKKKGFFKRLFGKKDKGEEETGSEDTGAMSTETGADTPEAAPGPSVTADAKEMAAAREALDRGDFDAAYNAYYDLANEGDPVAQYQLGLLYYQGLGIRQNYSEASYWYQQAGKKGNADAQYSLGNMYLMGEGVSQDDAAAISWYEKAAAQGHVAAEHNVDNLKRVTEAEASSVDDMESALANEQLDASVVDTEETLEKEKPRKGFFKRLFGKKEKQEADDTVAEVAAVQGPLPQIQPADEVEEIPEVEEAEEVKEKKKGFFGRLFGKKDKEEQAAEEMAMAESEPVAMESPAVATSVAEPGQSFENAVQSLKEYEKGLAYSFGDGVPQNDTLAFEAFLRSAEMGHTPAQYKTGVAYAYGEGVDKNPEQAVYWYKQAAEKGYALAQRNLGVMYMNGDGIEQNKPLAFAWQSILAEGGNVMDVHRRDSMQQQLSDAEIDEAMALKASLKH